MPIVSPAQIDEEIPVIAAVITGGVLTDIVIVVVSVHPEPFVPTTVYVVFDAGVAVTPEPVVALRPVAGVHEYVVAPDAVKLTLLPWHTDGAGGATVTVGTGLTATVTIAESVHVPLEPTTVYVVADVIVTIGLGQFVQLNPVAGDQL
jgi:hypothetical protein